MDNHIELINDIIEHNIGWDKYTNKNDIIKSRLITGCPICENSTLSIKGKWEYDWTQGTVDVWSKLTVDCSDCMFMFINEGTKMYADKPSDMFIVMKYKQYLLGTVDELDKLMNGNIHDGSACPICRNNISNVVYWRIDEDNVGLYCSVCPFSMDSVPGKYISDPDLLRQYITTEEVYDHWHKYIDDKLTKK